MAEHTASHLLPHTRCHSVMLGMFPCPRETARLTCGHILGLLVSQSNSGPSGWEVRVDSTGRSGWGNRGRPGRGGRGQAGAVAWPSCEVPWELSLAWSGTPCTAAVGPAAPAAVPAECLSPGGFLCHRKGAGRVKLGQGWQFCLPASLSLGLKSLPSADSSSLHTLRSALSTTCGCGTWTPV